jgi:cellobiose phosphorylase
MNYEHFDLPDSIVISRSTMDDVLWLLDAVNEFVAGGELSSIDELLGYAHDHLSADGLSNITGNLTTQMRKRMEPKR